MHTQPERYAGDAGRHARHTAGIAYAATSALAYGSLGLFARVALRSGVDLPTLLAIRFTIAAVTLNAIVLLRGQGYPRGSVLAGLLAVGAIGYAGKSFTYFVALTKADTGLVSVLYYVAPAMIALAAWLLYRERVTRTTAVAIAATLAGVALTVGGVGQGTMAGVGFALLSAAIFSAHSLASTRLVRVAGAYATAAVVIGATATVFVTATLIRGPVFPGTPAGWFAVVWLGLVSTVVAVLAFYASLERISAAEVATVSTMEPAFNLVLGVTLLHEQVGAAQWLGAALILAAVVGLARSRHREALRA